MATELAKAYVQIIPSAKGIQGSITDVLSGESKSAGTSSGKSLASSLVSSLKSTMVGLGIGKIITDGIADTSAFETAMAKVNTLFDSSKGVAFEDLQQDILNLSSAYGVGATTLAEAAYSAESAGVSVENISAMLEGSAQLATAGILVCVLLKELGVPYLVAKANDELHAKVLRKIGVDRVVFPERDMGARLARNLLNAAQLVMRDDALAPVLESLEE